MQKDLDFWTISKSNSEPVNEGLFLELPGILYFEHDMENYQFPSKVFRQSQIDCADTVFKLSSFAGGLQKLGRGQRTGRASICMYSAQSTQLHVRFIMQS
jgi:hypothetical protein